MRTLRVKICGIQNLECALAACQSGIDFLGFNFVNSSKRYIYPSVVKKIIKRLPLNVKIVGVFQDESLVKVNEIVEDLGLDLVQLHGREDPTYCSQVKVPVLKKISLCKQIEKTERILKDYVDNIFLFLVDRKIQGKGKMADLHQVERLSKKYPIMLAGGINRQNIADVLKEVGEKIYAVDINSGVETRSGQKDGKLIRELLLRIHAFLLDRKDPLREYKYEFYLLPEKIYMDGNSLGLFSKRAEASLAEIVTSYKMHAIDGWTKGDYPFFYLSETLGDAVAPLLGALPEEVVIGGSTTVNIHQLLATFFKPYGKRQKILIEESAFPTDRYAIMSQLSLQGLDPKSDLVVVRNENGNLEENIIAAMSETVAIAFLPVILYQSGKLLSVEKLVNAAHKKGILIGFDACHSVGIIPHRFHKIGVDFGVFCTYKYLNGGPGASAGLFVHTKHLEKTPGLSGWFGSDKTKQFDMSEKFYPAESAGKYQIGTPHILSIAPLLGSLALIKEAGISAIRKKSLALTDLLIECIDAFLTEFGFVVVTPRPHIQRGGHVAISHKNAASVCKALKENGVISDFRSPSVIRLAPSPLYTSFDDVYQTIQIIRRIMEERQYEKFVNKREVIA